MHQHIPSSNDLYYNTFQRSFLAIIKGQGLYDMALQTDKGRELVKEFEGDAVTILSKLHHYHTQSNVAHHEVVTLTTYITILSNNQTIPQSFQRKTQIV